MDNRTEYYKARVRVGDLNYGNHLAHDKLISIIHDSRVWWLCKNGLGEWLPQKHVGLVIVNLNIDYLNEAFLGDELSIEIFMGNHSKSFFELCYLVTGENTKCIAKCFTKMVAIDLEKRKVRRLPQEILDVCFKLRSCEVLQQEFNCP